MLSKVVSFLVGCVFAPHSIKRCFPAFYRREHSCWLWYFLCWCKLFIQREAFLFLFMMILFFYYKFTISRLLLIFLFLLILHGGHTIHQFHFQDQEADFNGISDARCIHGAFVINAALANYFVCREVTPA